MLMLTSRYRRAEPHNGPPRTRTAPHGPALGPCGSSTPSSNPVTGPDGSYHVVPGFVRADSPSVRGFSGVKGSGECGRPSGGGGGRGGRRGEEGGGATQGPDLRHWRSGPARSGPAQKTSLIIIFTVYCTPCWRICTFLVIEKLESLFRFKPIKQNKSTNEWLLS